ncbi:universal stress protein [soil metagenome]
MTIVVAYRSDIYGRAALAYGAKEALARHEKLIVVNATKNDDLTDTSFALAQEVDEIQTRLSDQGIETEVQQGTVPDIADAVLEAVQSVNASVLVVGIKRRSPVGKLVLGSTAQRLILDAPCPVYAVKPD